MAERRRVSFVEPLRVREFRALWLAELFSIGGDQIARVALSLVVFARTSSAALTAVTYALTFVPSVLGGFLLSGLADRYPRRTVLIVTDIVRALLAAAMALPMLPLPALWICTALLSAAVGPFKAAQLAIMPQILGRERFPAGAALRQFTGQIAQLVAFASGGFLLSVIEPHLGMLLNAVTFLLSALIIVVGVRAEQPAIEPSTEKALQESATESGGRQQFVLFALVLLIGFYVVPEGLAAPYAHALGASAVGVGLLFAADPIGSALGAWLSTRLRIPVSPMAAALLAASAGVPLILCTFQVGLVVSIALWALSGALSTVYLIQTQTLVVDLVPDARRGRVMGRMATCLYSSQGIAILAGGVAAEAVGPFRAVALSGLVATALALVIGMLWFFTRSRRRTGSERGSAATDVRDHQSLLPMDGTSSQRTDCLDGPSAEVTATAPTGGPPGDASTSSMKVKSPIRADQGRTVTHRIWMINTWKLWALPPRVLAYVLSIESAAVIATVFLADFHVVTQRDLLRCGVLVVLGLAAAEVTHRVEQLRRRFSDTPHVNMSSVWTLAAALLLPPGLTAAAAVVLYGHMWARSWRRVSGMNLYRALFSVSSVILTCYAAAAFVKWFPDAAALNFSHLAGVVGLILVIAVYWLMNSSLVAGVIALSQGERSLARLAGSWSENTLEFATLCVGVIVALLMSVFPLALAFVLLPLFVLTRSVLVRQLELAATTDQKTGLLNATTWQSLALKEIDRARRHKTPVGVLMVDVDHFKGVNDTYGHLVGDDALRAIARTIKQSIRSYDLCGRFGGEEFVVLLPDTDTDAAVDVGNQICEAVRAVRLNDLEQGDPLEDLRLSVSIGAAAYPMAGDDLEEVLLAADNVVFAAKDAGRDRVHAITPLPERGRSNSAG